MVKGFTEEAFVKHGIVADITHRYPNSLGDDLPPLTRILLPTRELDGENFAVQQQRDWNSPETRQAWQQSWMEYLNDALKEMQMSVTAPERTSVSRTRRAQ